MPAADEYEDCFFGFGTLVLVILGSVDGGEEKMVGIDGSHELGFGGILSMWILGGLIIKLLKLEF